MTSPLKYFINNIGAKRFFSVAVSLFIVVVFFTSVLGLGHINEVFEYDTDEGLFLMRAFLHAKGYSLYKDIWMDSPPLLVLLLSGLINIFGPSVFYARVLILIFSSLLIWCLFQIINKTQNLLSALFTIGLLILSSYYVRLSISVMTGLPAVALAMLSSYNIFLYQKNYQKRYLFLSGCFLAMALQTKFFVIPFLPALLGEVVIIERGRPEKQKCLSRCLLVASCWFITLLVIYLYLAFIATSFDFSQLIQPNIKIRSGGMAHGLFPGYSTVQSWIIQEYDILLLAIGAFIFLRREEKSFLFVPFVCFVLGAFIFSMHFPIWYHHRLLVLVPMCWLASLGFYKLFNKKTWGGWNCKSKILKIRDILAILFLGLVLILTVSRTPLKYKRMANEMKLTFTDEQRLVIDLMELYSEQTHLVVTDRPIFSFYANLPVHPYLATSSWKRMAAGLLTAEDFIGIIRKEQPELVLLGRFPWLMRKIGPHIEDNYRLEYRASNDSLRLYVLNRVKKDIKKRH